VASMTDGSSVTNFPRCSSIKGSFYNRTRQAKNL